MKPVTVYAEMTPNPNTMKFVTDYMLVPSGNVVEFLSAKDAKGYSTFAEALFNFPFVTRIFIAQNFVTVYKNEMIEWDDITAMPFFIISSLAIVKSFKSQILLYFKS